MSTNNNLHPSVQQFKQFVKRHPLLIKEVRKKEKTWQQIYEEWVVLGEDNEHWNQYRKMETSPTDNLSGKKDDNKKTKSNSEDTSESLAGLLGMLKKINVNDLQQHMTQVSGLLSNIQSIMGAFQGEKQSGVENNHQQNRKGGDPFSFRRH